jgi:hypothetical protein
MQHAPGILGQAKRLGLPTRPANRVCVYVVGR